MISVSIVIPNWNGREKLEQNLPEVLKVKNVLEVIIVDDASSDDSVGFIQRNFPQIKLITKQKNTGFGSNVNLGVKNANGEIVFLLNTDAVPEPNCLDKALKHFDDPKVFSVGFNTGGNWSWGYFEKGFFWHYSSPGNIETHDTLWASGGSALFRKEIWDKLGGFDPIYDPFYVEDVDLGYRAWKRGYINIWEKDSKVEHYKQKGVIATHFKTNFVQDTSERNILIFTWKNITESKLTSQHFFGLLKRLLVNPKYTLIFFKALIRLPYILEKRGIEKKEAVKIDSEILNMYRRSV